VAARRQASDAAQIRLFCGSLGPFYEPTSAVGFSWTWTAGVLAGDLAAVRAGAVARALNLLANE
jgi:hypothetical protein